MTQALKEYETPEYYLRRSMASFWSIRHDTERLDLEESLTRQGRLYLSEYGDE